MAVSTSSDWPLTAFNNSSRRQKLQSPFPVRSRLFKTLPSLPFPCPKLVANLHATSSDCPSSVLEEPSSLVPLVEFKDQLPGSATLNAFLRGLFETPETEELAFECYKKAKARRDFKPEGSTVDLVAEYLMRAKKWESVSALSDDFKVYDLLPGAVTCARLISSCVEARKFRVVEGLLKVFVLNREVPVLAFAAAMREYNRLHMFSSTILVFERMQSSINPNLVDPACYFRAMEAHTKIGNTMEVIKLFEEFKSKEFGKAPFSGQILGLVCESLCKAGRVSEALQLFQDMRVNGIVIDTPASVYSSLVSSLSNAGEVKLAEELLTEAERQGKVLRDPDMYLKLVLMYVEEGMLEKTLEVVEAMRGPKKLRVSDCIFCAIVNGFSKKRGYRSAAQIYEKLVSLGCEPGQVTYASAINAYARIGLHSKAEEIFSEMETKGFDKCLVAYSNMISIYGKTGRLGEAMRLLGKMKAKGIRPNVWVYNSLLDMHGRVRNLKRVEKLWKEMERSRVVPDRVSYTSLIGAYNRAHQFESCIEFYHEYRAGGGGIDRAMGGIMVGVFSKSGRVDELVKLLSDMKTGGTGLDGRLYRTALNALRDAGLQSQAKWLQGSFEAIS
ncbi:pentatricopeptide repeat-containing protein At5g13770, chloroplastic [Punica granatum]|uniref:Pentatricopeptide repeat-containing protein At5g13770, chloroplastic n=2 Tax=Punica granatum TaxID=22663 RepID=A0A6P8BVI1_PUNGR|nr:pentatricopeptide repeat-containing protein At5g13770, chloroplastic [Punica granatum]PKI47361.1 hypothetical protein CRG98_032196 [Punica granatum]